MHKVINRLTVIALICTMVISLSGCGETVPFSAFNDLMANITTVSSEVQTNLDKLRSNGLITDDIAVSITNNMRNQLNVLNSLDIANVDNLESAQAEATKLEPLAKAITEYYVYSAVTENKDAETVEAENNDYNSYLLPNAVIKASGSFGNAIYDVTKFPKPSSDAETSIKNNRNVTVNKVTSTVAPIKFVSNENANTLNELVNMNLYVLREEYKDLKEVQDAIKSGKGFQKYFKNTNKAILKSNSKLVVDKEYTFSQTIPGAGNSGMLDTMKVKFTVLNSDAVNELIENLGLSDYSSSKYLVIRDGAEKGVYLMEYPVSYVAGFETNVNDRNIEYKAVVKLSDLRLNIMTGEILKQRGINFVDADGNSFNAADGKSTSKLNELYKIGNNSDSVFTSSFITYQTLNSDEFKIVESGKYDAGDELVDIPTMLLLDYLEAVYYPNAISYNSAVVGNNVINEKIVCFGRMIRLYHNKLSGSYDKDIDNEIGFYVEPLTGESANNKTIKITELVDAKQLNGSNLTGILEEDIHNPFKARLPRAVSEEIYIENVIGYEAEQRVGKVDSANKLETFISANVYPTVKFPGGIPSFSDEAAAIKAEGNNLEDYYTSVNERMADYFENNALLDFDEAFETVGTSRSVEYSDNNNNSPVFYAMTVGSDLSLNGLFEYLASDRADYSFSWWTKWLTDNNLDYGNKLKNSVAEINRSLREDYKYSTNDEFIYLDLDVISRINEDFQSYYAKQRLATIRTVFKVLGFIFIWYAIFLVMAWILDTNIDLGQDLLGKMTFNSMIAVKSKEGIIDNKGKYCDLGNVLKSSAVILMVGLILVAVDFLAIISFIIEVFSGFVKTFSEAVNR